MLVKRLQIEVTMKCVDEPCRFCNRMFMKENDLYEENVLDTKPILDVFKNNNIDVIHFTAAAGESSYHDDFTEIIQTAREESNVSIDWNTNGYPRDNEWWYEVGKLLNRDADVVQFALDGINKETHNIHRNNDFDEVFSHMVSFIKGGGNALWQMVIFKHNENQIEGLKKIAKMIGCKGIIIRNSKNYDDVLQCPTSLNYNRSRLDLFHENIDKNIICDSIVNGIFFIDASGYFWPCCTIPGYQQIDKVYKKLGIESAISDRLLDIFEKEKDVLSIYNESDLSKIISKSKLWKYVYENTDNELCCDYYCNANRKLGENFSRVIYF